MIRVGLVDSGIDLLKISKNSNLIFDGWKGSCLDYKDRLGHGTKCANLILKT